MSLQIVPTLVTPIEPEFNINMSGDTRFKRLFKSISSNHNDQFKLEFQGLSDSQFKTIFDIYRASFGEEISVSWPNEYIPSYLLILLDLTTEDIDFRIKENSLKYSIQPRSVDVEFLIEVV